MLKTYLKYIRLYNSDGEEIRSDAVDCILDEADAIPEEYVYTWDNIHEYIENYGYYFDEIISKRKGRVVRLYGWNCNYYWEEWKHDLKVTKKITYKEYQMSMSDIMKIRNSDLVIEYFKQRGLSVCPMK